jgi:hypothetical protein
MRLIRVILTKTLIITLSICYLGCFFLFGQQQEKARIIYSAFDPNKAEWNISWPGRVSQYDLVYKSPPIDPMQGIPLGNGDVGGLFWCEDSKIIIVVNKCDLIDSTLRHASRIIIDFKYPVFKAMYLSDFDARLNLSSASLNLEATSPFGKVGLKAFIDHRSGILLCELESDLDENVPLDVAVERFGSRSFSAWYSQIDRDATFGLSGTEAFADDNSICITQKLSSGTFAIAGSVINDNDLKVSYSREHSRRAVIQLSGDHQKNAQLVFAVTSPGIDNPVDQAKILLSHAHEKGFEPFRESHLAVWKSIWNRSFIDYGDDYLNNLWYLTMYYANASQGGKYPGRFVNGLWGWSHDVQNWSYYFHWNQQQLYWPLNAAGFHDLVSPYLNFRFNSLPYAKRDARKIFNTDGAFISDVVYFNGSNMLDRTNNHTPVAEIALEFWRQYQYTGDKQFLKEKALPYILDAAKFFESLLAKEEDGLYHARESTGYEGWILLKDGLTDLVYAQVIFTTAMEALKVADMDIPDANKWNEIVKYLAPLPVVKSDATAVLSNNNVRYKLNRGFFKGKTSSTNKIFAAGCGIEDKKWLTVYYPTDDTTRYGLKLLDGIFPSVPFSPVFPSGLIGLSQEGSILFDQMTTTALLYGSEATGWDPAPVVLARLGLSKELSVDLERFPGRWQIYCNGWGHWGLEHDVYGKDYHQIEKDANCFFRTYEVQDIASNEKLPLRMWPFRYTSMESMSVLATAMNESLLQSYDGVLRIFPAFPSNKAGRFTLHAVGGFIVSSEIREGEVQWMRIQSLFGNSCKVYLPWKKAIVYSSQKRKSKQVNGDIVEINTIENEIIFILPDGHKLDSWSVMKEDPLPNKNVKYHSSGKAQLGIPRMF